AAQNSCVSIDLEDVVLAEPSFVQGTGGHGQTGRVARNHSAEISARTQNPAPSMKIGSQTRERDASLGQCHRLGKLYAIRAMGGQTSECILQDVQIGVNTTRTTESRILIVILTMLNASGAAGQSPETGWEVRPKVVVAINVVPRL